MQSIILLVLLSCIGHFADGSLWPNVNGCDGYWLFPKPWYCPDEPAESQPDIAVKPTTEPKTTTSSSVEKGILKDNLNSSCCKYLIDNGYHWKLNSKYLKELCAASLDPNCKPLALGMENGEILDSQITASQFEYSIYRPQQGRLYYKGDGWSKRAQAWEPFKPQLGEWIQVDLGKETTVTGVATQGNGRPKIMEWTTKYSLQYSHDGNAFEDYEGGKLFCANKDKNTVVKNDIDPPIQARFVRLLPKAWKNWNALRMELYGCSRDIHGDNLQSGRVCAVRALGMQNGEIPDSSITATSYFHRKHLPSQARLNHPYQSILNPGSWAIHRQYAKVGDWIQVDLKNVITVTGIATQGSSQKYKGYIKSYSLKYSNDGNEFVDYHDGKVLNGNNDINTVVKYDLIPPINARYIRLYPKTWSHERISLRFELYGCKAATSN